MVVPEAFILGSGELHVDMGSTINLVCIIEKVITHDFISFHCKRQCSPFNIITYSLQYYTKQKYVQEEEEEFLKRQKIKKK